MEALPQAPRDAAGYVICDDELQPCMENRFHDIEKRLQFCVTSCCNLNDRLHALEQQQAELRDQVDILSFSARLDASPGFSREALEGRSFSGTMGSLAHQSLEVVV